MTLEMPPVPADTLEARALAVRLHPTERRIVDELLAIAPYEVGTMTSSDLSERSGASRSSIDRLSRKLGYAGLKDMRRALALDAGRRGEGLSPEPGEGDGGGDIATRVMGSIATRAMAFAEALQRGGELETLVSLLLSARSIHLFGAGESSAACSAIHVRLVRLGLPISFHEEYHTQVTLASLMQPSDVAIAVSHSGSTRSTHHALSAARQQGAQIVLLTGKSGSVLSQLADLVIQFPSGRYPGSGEVIDRILAMGLAEILFQNLVIRRSEFLSNSVRIDDAFDEERL